jgi:hypothetical protein
MNYTKVYNDLIEKRRKYPLDKKMTGCENHHILPRAKGGTDISENIVRLTVKEHIFSHQLLARIYDDQSSWVTNIGRRCIKWCLDGKQKHADGFLWKYEDVCK